MALRVWWKNACCALALLLGLIGVAGIAGATPSASEDQLIQTLIQRVAARSDMVFIRNGGEHSAADAAKHMRAKYDHFKNEIVTAEDFIAKCATRSEMTKASYKVKMAGSDALRDASEFMLGELKAVRQKP